MDIGADQDQATCVFYRVSYTQDEPLFFAVWGQ